MPAMGEKGTKSTEPWIFRRCGLAGPWRSRWRRWSRPLGCIARPSGLVVFLLASFLASSIVAIVFFRLWVSSFLTVDLVSTGCRPDGEGSWSIGIFYGKSPFSLSPIELSNKSNEKSSAWPVANPVLTCASVSNAGYPSNFVADPFLFIQDNTFYLFFETKTVSTMQGDIGVARSVDQGATWEFLGIALNEAWHLSYPYVFNYLNETYMMPEGSEKGDLRLYRATKFPLEWTFEKVLVSKPLVDTSLVHYNGYYWLFTSDFSRSGTEKNAEFEIWFSNSPLGPWKEHRKNPIYRTNKSLGARNGGRPFIYEGSLYRPGQDCSRTYGRRLRVYKVEKLTKEEYKEIPVSDFIEEAKKGRNSWNGVRYHHLDPQLLPSGTWVAVIDGDRVPSGDSTTNLLLGWTFLLLLFLLVVFLGLLVGVVDCIHPQGGYLISSRRNEPFSFFANPHFSSKLRRYLTGLSRCILAFKGRVKLRTCNGKLAISLLSVIGALLVCMSVQYFYGGNGAEEAYMYNGQFSQFTMLTMTYDARLWNLKQYVKHYSRCSSVREIVVVWNKGKPPAVDEFDSTVPVRIRVEAHNSLNNRFKYDPLIRTRAVLELDDDILMTCNDVEKGFRVWREHHERIVGFYPRLLNGSPLKYRDAKYARRRNGYNVILTGAAFMDAELAFKRYWSDEATKGRDVVDKLFNCEDILMNFLFANASTRLRTVEYVHPSWAIDTSKFSASAISRNTQQHYDIRTECLLRFSSMYGSLPELAWDFGSREDGWDV